MYNERSSLKPRTGKKKPKLAYIRDLPKVARLQCVSMAWYWSDTLLEIDTNQGLSWTIMDYHGLALYREVNDDYNDELLTRLILLNCSFFKLRILQVLLSLLWNSSWFKKPKDPLPTSRWTLVTFSG